MDSVRQDGLLKYAVDICAAASASYGVDPPVVAIRAVSQGRHYPRTNTVVIPLATVWVGEAYFVYYVLHEVAHHIHYILGCGGSTHGYRFRTLEDALLADFKVSIRRQRVFPKLQDVCFV